MFLLYPIVLGLLLGVFLGGRASGLGSLQLRWGWVFAAGLGIQIVLFSAPVTERIGELGVPIYVLSTALVVLAVILNRRIIGMPLVALGAISNLVAIVANGGYMPASAAAMAALGKSAPTVYSNSAIVPDPVLWPLTDIFALPTWLPGANVFSLGDVLIALGVIVVIVSAMRRPATVVVGAA